MKKVMIIVAALGLPSSGFAQEFEFGPNGFSVEPPHYHHRHECAELRQACIHKRELGEEGEGNCARYRRECGDHY
jgi:hypothetical protein